MGPRFDRVKDGKFVLIHGHHKVMGFMGMIILWVGWIAFNASSASRLDHAVQTAVMARSVRCVLIAACSVMTLS